MIWQLRIQYANGTEQVLKSFKNRETALKCVDQIYKDGYPLHFAYVVRAKLEDPEVTNLRLGTP